jgi:predicted TIM-barrel fold metal-dependent hydrolase
MSDAPRLSSTATQEAPSEGGVLKVDACAHPVVTSSRQLVDYLPNPWRQHGYPGPEDYDFVRTEAPFLDADQTDGLAGSDPELLHRRTCIEQGMNRVVLVPRTRGLLPNLDLNIAVCAATNQWLAEQWLDSAYREQFVGTIRIDPRDPRQAVAEIERWADHPQMVQVAVTTQSLAPYGQRQYDPVWEAVEAHGLPLLVSADGGAGVHFPQTVSGKPSFYIEKAVLYPSNSVFHVASMLAEGTFEKFPALKVVFGDGGLDFLPAMMWRMHKDWRGNHAEVPWIKKSPIEYVRSNVRFLTDGLAGVDDADAWSFWMGLGFADELLLYASKYPKWDFVAASEATTGLPAEWRDAILGGTAAALYGLG